MIISYSLRKKGGDIIKKRLFFLIIMILIYIFNINIVYAENATFYEGEYIDGIYMNKYQYSNNTIYYQKARVFRNSKTNEFAYCIEPFSFFTDGSIYETTLNPNNLTNEQKDKITKIAHFGYKYGNHQEIKWYAVTQMMIWQEAGNTTGDFYFSDTLNGPKKDLYRGEINEILHLIEEYDKTPEIANKTYNIVEGYTLQITDSYNVLKYYENNNDLIKKQYSTIIFENPKKGNYEFTFTRKENNYNKPIIFYQSNNSQNLMETGDINNKEIKINVNVFDTRIDIIKIDKDTKSIIPSGEAILDGTIFTLYNEKNEEIGDYEIKDNIISINNIKFGKYYLKEKTPGKGYLIDNNTYEIEISKDNNIKELIIENEVIKKKVIIEKKYGENNIFNNEKNIDFQIINKKGDIIKIISTDESGKAEINLPYGEYKIIQINSTSGYSKVDPFTINIEDTEDEIIELKDYKIPVPDTRKNNNSILENLLLLIINILL